MTIKQILLGRTPQTEYSNTGAAVAERYPEQASAFLAPEEIKDIFAELGEQNEVGRTVPPTPALPGCFQLTHVALATILPEEKRMKASCAGLCYIQILGINDETPQYLACVAAIPSFLGTANSRKIHHLTLTRDQLRQMLPWDRTLQRLETCCVREVLQAYVRQLNGFDFDAQEQGLVAENPRELAQSVVPHKKASKTVWAMLPEVFVAASTAREIAERIQKGTESGGRKTYPQLLFWLKTMIAMLDRQLQHLGAQNHAALCHLYTKMLAMAERMVSVFKRRKGSNDRHFLVNASAVRRNGHCIGWHLVIGLPQAALREWRW